MMGECRVPDQEGDAEDSPPSGAPGTPVPPDLGAMQYLRAGWNGVARFTNPPASGSSVLSGVVQDLSGPLTALLTSTALLAEDLDGIPTEKRRVIESMRVKGLLLENRIENLLCAAAIWGGSFEIRPRLVELGSLLREVVSVVTPLLASKTQHVEVVTRDGGTHVFGDARRLAEVLVNLILNASEQAGPDSTIALQVRPKEASVRVSVADRGPGIPEERLPGLFELFHQPLFALGSGGMALGLPIVRAVVESHGGTVGARNRAGGGARVWFEIPQGERAAR